MVCGLRFMSRPAHRVMRLDTAVKVRVTAAPESGKANAAVLKLLARAWKIPRSTMEIVSGATARRKVVAVSGDPNAINNRINDWMETVSNEC
jgi:uncharacterized protein YggU (UPF0235/DUF167 family)